MTFGAHYKGDVSEVTMGHETGIFIQSGEPCGWTATTDNTSRDYTTITFTGTAHTINTTIFQNAKPIIKVPLGMLIGQKMTFHAAANSGNNFQSYYYKSLNSKIYSIVDHTLESNATVIKIVPAFSTSTSLASGAGDAIFVHSAGMPTLQSGTAFAMDSAADDSKEVSLLDQFIGLASFLTLPDTKVDIHKYHVVGLGRQAAVQQTGKVHHMGGTMEMPLHNARWLFYCLGKEVVSKDKCGARPHAATTISTILADLEVGQTYVDIVSSQTGSVRFGSDDAAIGDYLLIKDATLVPTTTYKAPSKGAGADFWPSESSASTLSNDTEHFEWTESSEIRRIIAIEALATTYRFRLYLDGGLQFGHTTADTLELRQYHNTHDDGSPEVMSNRTIQNPVHRLIFSNDTIPSFSIEHSVRTRDVGSYNGAAESTTAPGSTGDSKQLTRIFRGCKIVEWEITSTVDAELKFRAIFDALSSYTDTGRLESADKGDRYTAHRMFQNTADTAKGRKIAGIASGSEKPFMFYNGTIAAFGDDMTFISGFELRGKTGVEVFHTIQSNPVAESIDSATGISLKQVPYGGTRNASIIREGREEFEMEIDVILTDATLYHQLRTHVQQSGTVGATGGGIILNFTKPTNSDGDQYTTPSLRIVMDDYFITDCPIPVPDDKGLLHAKIMLHPQNIKVISNDTLYQS